MDITFHGEVTAVSQAESGTSQSGKQWSKQTIVLQETEARYPQSIAVQLFKDELVNSVRAGEVVTVHLTVKANEYNGRYFTNITAWKIERGDAQAPAQPAAQPQAAPAKQATVFNQQAENDDLPF